MAAQVLAQQTLAVAQQTEKKLDAELASLSSMGENDLQEIRRKRVQEMKERASKEQLWRAQGHLSYTELRDEKQWFEASKENERMICHFYRGTTWRCEIVDKHMEVLAKKHVETKFCKINAENCPFLAEKLNIVLLPTIILTKDNFCCDRIEGFDELGGRDDFSADTLEKRLAKHQVIDVDESVLMGMGAGGPKSLTKKIAANKGVKTNPNKKAIYASASNRKAEDSDEEDNEEDEAYN